MLLPPNMPEGVIAFFTERGEHPVVGPEATLVNKRIIGSLKDFELYTLEQRHTDRVVVLTEKAPDRDEWMSPDFEVISPQATEPSGPVDGVITDIKGVLLCVQVADCVPILLAQREAEVVGAVHAGWRGTSRGILKRAIRAMRTFYGISADEILISMGPSIRGCCYEVGEEVVRMVGQAGIVSERDGRAFLDLARVNHLQALSEGVPLENISIIDGCTCCEPDRFYSFRRERTSHRQGGFIGIRR